MAFDEVRRGSHSGFAAWVRLTEMSLRRSLAGFAQQVDVEAVLQEGLARMWLLAPKLRLQGRDASLRYAGRLMRNLAISEIRRHGREIPGRIPDPPAPPLPDPTPDRVLRAAIQFCLKLLKGVPGEAMMARLRDGGASADSLLAAEVGMQHNTFLQNIVRARRQIRECLRRRGIEVEEHMS